MDLVFEAFSEMRLTENHIRQLHQHLLRHRDKDERHRGSSKTLPNNVVAFDAGTRESGVVFGTATPFETPRETEALVARSYDTAALAGGLRLCALRIAGASDRGKQRSLLRGGASST